MAPKAQLKQYKSSIKILEIKNVTKVYKKRTVLDDINFDVYEGENLPEGKKSVAIALTFQPIESTFTDQDIENLMKKVEVEVGKKTGASLRQ